MGAPVRAFSSAVPPAWSMWPWVIQIFSTVRPCWVMAAISRGISPPGSITAAFFVFSHQTTVQFCCSGVTGAMIALIGEVVTKAPGSARPYDRCSGVRNKGALTKKARDRSRAFPHLVSGDVSP